MKTQHKIYFKDCSKMGAVKANTVDLVVTSPPYPMIEMWDGIFSQQNPLIEAALIEGSGFKSFELMHEILDPIWAEVYRVLKYGGFACINMGDATRTINGNFGLYPNHMRILKRMVELGFTVLPCILWRKQTNAPNKFMGSGMLPAGAYVTLEHEYILIFRKGSKREFKKEHDKKRRRESAIFWEERNSWYSDVWFDIKGVLQIINDKDARLRSAAYPFELAHRLVNMYSVKGDVVLDPFLGTGTTMTASMASGRNCIGYEIDDTLKDCIYNSFDRVVDYSNEYIIKRVKRHLSFLKTRAEKKKPIKYQNKHYNFPVVTSQEKEILFNELESYRQNGPGSFEVAYSQGPHSCLIFEGLKDILPKDTFISEMCKQPIRAGIKNAIIKESQLPLFD